MSVEAHQEGNVDLYDVTTVQAFPIGTFIENIAVRHSGQLLITVHNKSELIQVDQHSKAAPAIVYVFPAGVSGIVEVQNDIFYVSCGTIGEKGSWVIYKVDMSAFVADASGKVEKPAAISKHVEVPDAIFLNGSALLDHPNGTILVADSILGAVFAVDVHAATSKLWLKHEALGKLTDDPLMPGVNGIKFYKGYLYFSNSEANKFLRAGVTSTGDATGAVEVLQENIKVDDFIFDTEGAAYLTTHIYQSVVKLQSNGLRTRIAGGPEDVIVAGTTACAFGRTKEDRKVLYVTTTGGLTFPVNGQVGEARVLRIDTGHKGAPDSHP